MDSAAYYSLLWEKSDFADAPAITDWEEMGIIDMTSLY